MLYLRTLLRLHAIVKLQAKEQLFMHHELHHPTAAATPPRLDPNPIPHLTEGVKKLVRTNLKALFASIAAIVSVPVILLVAALIFASTQQNAEQLLDSLQQHAMLVGIFVGVLSLVFVCFGMVYSRIILLGAQAKPTSFKESLRFSIRRLLPVIGIYLVIGLVFALPAALITTLMLQVSPFFGFLFLLLLAIYAAASFFLTPLNFIVVDSPPLISLAAVTKRLVGIWKQGFLVLAVYILCMNFVGGGLGSFGGSSWGLPSGSNSSSSSSSTDSSEIDWPWQDSSTASNDDDINLEPITSGVVQVVLVISTVLVIFITTLSATMQAFLLAGLAHVYTTVAARRQNYETELDQTTVQT